MKYNHRRFGGPPRCNIRNCKTPDDNVTQRVPQSNKHHNGDVEHGLGDLDRLPLEVQSNILVQSDLQTLVGFRQVNRRYELRWYNGQTRSWSRLFAAVA
jgi:hypothetical protein